MSAAVSWTWGMAKCRHPRLEIMRLQSGYTNFVVDEEEVLLMGHETAHNGRWRAICHACRYDRTFSSIDTAPVVVFRAIMRVVASMRDSGNSD